MRDLRNVELTDSVFFFFQSVFWRWSVLSTIGGPWFSKIWFRFSDGMDFGEFELKEEVRCSETSKTMEWGQSSRWRWIRKDSRETWWGRVGLTTRCRPLPLIDWSICKFDRRSNSTTQEERVQDLKFAILKITIFSKKKKEKEFR